MKTISLAMFLAAATSLALWACAVPPTAPGVMVLPGFQKSAEQFQDDSTACQQQTQAQLAGDAQAANNQAVANAAVGAVVGAAAGALLGQGSYNPGAVAGWGAGTGLLIGSSVGGSNSQVASYTLQQRFDTFYAQCMYRRGHQVPGLVSYQGQPTVPAYPPPNYPPPKQPPPKQPPPKQPPPKQPPPAHPAADYHPLNYPPPN